MNRTTGANERALGVWLLVCCAMILVMVVLGGVTRLTGSGLSMVEWRPLVGAVPPLSEAEWHRTFELYRQGPEYRTVNPGMDLAGFKRIFWWEYVHRLWGRLIAVVFAVPFLWFLHGPATAPAPGPRALAGALAALVFVTLLSGGLVAGLDAGLAYNTFPLMDGRLLPEGMLALAPAWRNPFDNVAMVQFEHRLLGLSTAALVAVFWFRLRRTGGPQPARLLAHAMLAMAAVQVALGVATVLHSVPVALAVSHQAGAVVLFSLALWTRFELRPAPG